MVVVVVVVMMVLVVVMMMVVMIMIMTMMAINFVCYYKASAFQVTSLLGFDTIYIRIVCI